MKGLIIIGSAQVNSHTSALARYLTEHFKTHDIEAEIFDLAEKTVKSIRFFRNNTVYWWNQTKYERFKRESNGGGLFNIRNAKLSWFIFWNIEKCIRSSKYGLF